jgi:ubiquinone/menaquinone biosynthesis C-methylase UbiE
MEKRTLSPEFPPAGSPGSSDHPVRYPDLEDSLPESRRIRVRSYEYLDLKEGDSVLDAGCGPGYDALRMAAIVGSTGKVTGIDPVTRMIEIARENAARSTYPVSFQAGDVWRLDFPDAWFNAVRIDRILQIHENPGEILDELIRVLRPGGKILAIEPDWETFVCDPGDRDTARTFFRFCADQFPDGSAGRTLFRCFRERSLSDVVVHPEPLVMHRLALASKMLHMEQFLGTAREHNVLTQNEIDTWLQELAAADKKGRFTFAGMMFAVTGKK